jgi:hypothetical protein
MLENGIKYILQTGDLLDNRKIMDINLFDQLCVRLFDLLKEYKLQIVTYLGNHDIYFKNTRDINLVKYLAKLYPNVITLISDATEVNINNKRVLLLPWIVDADNFKPNLVNADYIFGHLEIKDFQISRGIVDERSELTKDSFKKVIKVYSGHYHIRSSKGKIQYLGVPTQLNWNDFGNEVGCTVFDEDWSETFIHNTVSNKYVVNTYINGVVSIDDGSSVIDVNLQGYKNFISSVKDTVVIKFIVQEAIDNTFEDFVFVLKENNVNYSFINNQEISQIINPENVKVDTESLQNTNAFIIEYVKENNPELLDLVTDILGELEVT